MLKALSHQELRRQSRRKAKGGEVKSTKYIAKGRTGGLRRRRPISHTFRRHYCTIWMSYSCHYVVWRCFLLTTITWYLTLWGHNAFCPRSSVGASHFEFHTSKHWVSTLGYMVSMKIWKLYYIALYCKQIFLPLLSFVTWTANVAKLATRLFDCARSFFKKSNVRKAFLSTSFANASPHWVTNSQNAFSALHKCGWKKCTENDWLPLR